MIQELRFVRYVPTFATAAELDGTHRAAKPDEPDLGVEPPPQPVGAHLTEDVETWLADAGTDSLDVVVTLVDTPLLKLPSADSTLAEVDPVLYLDQLEARTLALEDYKTTVFESQVGVVRAVEDGGGTVGRRYWLVNGFEATITRGMADALAADPTVRRIEVPGGVQPDAVGNQTAEIRDATQTDEFIASGITGETPSGRSSVTDMYVAVIDDRVDVDHPAWRDGVNATPSRLVGAWQECCSGSWIPDNAGMGATDPQHGTQVASFLVADLEDGQDATYSNPNPRLERSGLAPEASFAAIWKSGSNTYVGELELAVELDVDVVNLSSSSAVVSCDYQYASVDAVDNAMLAGVFVVNTPGNAGAPGGCSVRVPGNASGSFTAGAFDKTAANLRISPLMAASPEGGDLHGRALIDLVAAGGREVDGTTGFDASFNDAYSDATEGTSFAAPQIAAAAALYKDFMVESWGTATANTVGNVYAQMSLMGDGQLYPSGAASSMSPMDNRWGAGRLRMRKFDNGGMDAPWRMRWANLVLTDGAVFDLAANPNGFGINQVVPSAADWFQATLWWHEPNLTVFDVPAELAFQVTDGTTTYTSQGSMPGSQRLWLGGAVQNKAWTVRVTGTDVRPSTRTNYHYNLTQRTVFVAMFWEDRARDDADGPPADIQ